MKAVRILTMLLAVVVSGLVLVVASPAPPAAALLTRTFTQGSLEVVPGISPYCTRRGTRPVEQWWQTETSWLRRFHLADQSLRGAFTPALVTFGAELDLSPERASVPVRARVYRYPADDATLTSAELDRAPYVEGTVELGAVPAGGLVRVAVRDLHGLFATLDPATEDAVVEVYYAGGPAYETFVVGANTHPESAPTYRRARCDGQDEIGVRWPFSHAVIALEGVDNGFRSDLDGDGVPDDPVLDRCPRLVGPSDGDYPGCASFGQAVSAGYDAEDGVVVGNVSVDGPAGSGACVGQVEVEIRDAATHRVVGTAVTSGAARSYRWSSLGVAESTQLYAFVDGFLDRDAAGEGLGFCTSSAAAHVRVTGLDLDRDGVDGSADSCPTRTGTPTSAGCPVVAMRIAAPRYAGGVLSGALTVADPDSVPVPGACQQQPNEVVLSVGADTYWARAEPGSGEFSFEVALADTDRYTLSAQHSLDAGVAWCSAVTTEVTALVDGDQDGVRDSIDQCEDLAGGGDLTPGCPDLHRVVTASYTAGLVSGRVGFVDGRDPASACVLPEHTRVAVYELGSNGLDGDLLAQGHYSPADGTYSLDLDLEAATGYHVEVLHGIDPHAGSCAPANSGPHTVPDPDPDPDQDPEPEPDPDGDGVVSGADLCPTQDGATSEAGCPVLARVFSGVTFTDGAVSGRLALEVPKAGVCESATEVVLTPGGGGPPVTGETTEGTGVFTIPVVLADEDDYLLSSAAYLDAPAGWCAETVTEATVETDRDDDGLLDHLDACPAAAGSLDDPDSPGCPTLARTVTAAYADNAISGQVAVQGPHPAPPGACLPTRVRAFTVHDGTTVQAGQTTDTAADGSYTVAVPDGLPAGTTYYVTTERHRPDQTAICAAAQSAPHPIPTPPTSPPSTPPADPTPPGGLAPPGTTTQGPVLTRVRLTKTRIHIAASARTPRTTRLKLQLSATADVVVTIKATTKATSKVTGKKKASLTMARTLPPGRTSIKLTTTSGKKTLPPGTYTVTLHATNAHGTTHATAGHLTLTP